MTHDYGPYDPTTGPWQVEEPVAGAWGTRKVDLDDRVRIQRAQISAIARGQDPPPMPGAPPANWRRSTAADLMKAERRRDQQMGRAHAAAPPGWKDQVRHALWEVAKRGDPFTVDDVWAELERRGVPTPQEPRALGPVVSKALRSGVIRDTGQMAKSVRRHGTKITVYERNHLP